MCCIINLPFFFTSIVISIPWSSLQTSKQSWQSSGVPEQDPPKEGGKQEPMVGPLMGWVDDILTEQPLLSLHV